MKSKAFTTASRLAILALALTTALSFNSCSKDEGNEPSVEELLSEETTPVEFKFPYYTSSSDRYILFDYAGNNFVRSDSTQWGGITIDLRQGKHRLLWLHGLTIDEEYSGGVRYDPKSQTCVMCEERGFTTGNGFVLYEEKNIEVFPYLLPVQEINFGNTIMCSISINITDVADNLSLPEQIGNSRYQFIQPAIGKMKGYPFVREVSVTGNAYKLKRGGAEKEICTYYFYDSRHRDWKIEDHFEVVVDRNNVKYMLCPLNGIDNIQLTAEVNDKDGKPVPTTTLPKFSIRRGYETVLTGPLFSGSTSDWTVEMVPCNEERMSP